MTSRNLKLLILGLTIFLSSLLAQNVRAQVPPAGSLFLICHMGGHCNGAPVANNFLITLALNQTSVSLGTSVTATVKLTAGPSYRGIITLTSTPPPGINYAIPTAVFTIDDAGSKSATTTFIINSTSSTTTNVPYAIAVKGTDVAGLNNTASQNLVFTPASAIPPCVKAVAKPAGW